MKYQKTFFSHPQVIILSFVSLSLPLAFAYASVSVSIQSLSPSTNVSVGTHVTFTVAETDFVNPTYNLSDSFGGGNVTSSNIDSSGNFSWTPTQNDIGTHNFTITVSDSSGNSFPVQEQITVSAASSVSIQSLSPGAAVNAGQAVSFSVVQSGFTNPSYSISDSFSGSTVSNANINSSGNFSWTPAVQDVGNHQITIAVSDSNGHSTNISESLTVNAAVTVSIQSLSPGVIINPGQNVTFSAVGSGFSNPTYSLSDSFGGSTISNSNINSSGNFSWTPAVGDAGTHTITVYGVDSLGHNANASVTTIVNSGVTTVLTAPTPSASTTTGVQSSPSSGLTPAQIQSVLSLLQSFGASPTIINNVVTVLSTQTTTTGTPAVSTITTQLQALQNKLAELQAQPASSASHLYKFTKALTSGSSGAEVTELQKRLSDEGFYDGPTNGHFGPLTQAAVKKYQLKHGLTQLGNVGPATRAALNE